MVRDVKLSLTEIELNVITHLQLLIDRNYLGLAVSSSIGVFHGVAGVARATPGLMELPSTGKGRSQPVKYFPYDFASEVRYTVNVRKSELVKKKLPPQ